MLGNLLLAMNTIYSELGSDGPIMLSTFANVLAARRKKVSSRHSLFASLDDIVAVQDVSKRRRVTAGCTQYGGHNMGNDWSVTFLRSPWLPSYWRALIAWGSSSKQ